MRPESRKYLWDALQAADRISRFVSGKSFDDYKKDELLRSGVERQFEVIGESLAQLSRLDSETAATIPRVVADRSLP